MSNITIIGAGGTGHALAADFGYAGFDVTLYEEPEFEEKLGDITSGGSIEITGALGPFSGKVNTVTTSINTALQGAELIFVAVAANRHERIAELCSPYLVEGQTIVIAPDNGGSLVFSNVLKKKAIYKKVYIAGSATNYYSCRLIGPARVIVGLPRRNKRLAAFPAKDTPTVLNRLSVISSIHNFVPGTNVLEIALSSTNIIIHVAGSLLNAGAIENSGGQFYLYRQGITPSIMKCASAVSLERQSLFKVMGYTINQSDVLERVAVQGKYPELDLFRSLIGPTSLQHRYITEDASTGQTLMLSLGEMVGINMPVTRALLTLASVINQVDYINEGRTISKLGLSGLSIEKLNKYLEEGN